MLSFDIAPVEDPDQRITLTNVFSSPMLRLSEHSVPVHQLQERWPHVQGISLQDCGDLRPLLRIGSDRPDHVIPIENFFGPESAPVAVRTKL